MGSAATFDRMWAELGPIGRDPATGGYRRFAWTAADHTLREWFSGECARLGLDLVEDRAGNQWAWWGDPDACPGIVAGSHLDSVPDGGAYDGPLGVVSALAAVERLQDSGFRPTRPIGVVNFVDEEGARFGIACAGSRIITGALTADRALALRDADGVTLARAWSRAGRDTAQLGADPDALRRVAGFIELHVEQGKALADLDPATSAVAIGTDIWPHGRWRADFSGRADHAGTTALADRLDALVEAASFIGVVRERARLRNDEIGRVDSRGRVVATVGKVDVQPGGVNAIPSHVTAWVDARATDEDAVRALASDLESIVPQDGWRQESWTPTTRFDPVLIEQLSTTLGRPPRLGTGAGHDAGILANAGVPTAMLFVRNPTGTSHSPQEFAERDDCLAGIDALTAGLCALTGV